MFGSEIVEVAIGLIFVFLLASLVSSAIREGIAKLLKTRAKNLEKELMDILNEALVKAVYKNQLIREPEDPEAKKKPAEITKEKFAAALLDTLVNTTKDKKGEFAKMKEGIEKIDNPQIRNGLLKVLTNINADVSRLKERTEEIRKAVEAWYDKLMEKLSLWYRKRSREVLFVIGLLLCSFLNFDTFMMVKTLYQDDTMREAVAAVAVDTVNKPLDETVIGTPPELRNKVSELQAKLEQLGFPVGWELDKTQSEDPRGIPEDFLPWLYKILGIIITAVAVSFGAPFWFDLLKKLADLKRKQKKEPEAQT